MCKSSGRRPLLLISEIHLARFKNALVEQDKYSLQKEKYGSQNQRNTHDRIVTISDRCECVNHLAVVRASSSEKFIYNFF